MLTLGASVRTELNYWIFNWRQRATELVWVSECSEIRKGMRRGHVCFCCNMASAQRSTEHRGHPLHAGATGTTQPANDLTNQEDGRGLGFGFFGCLGGSAGRGRKVNIYFRYVDSEMLENTFNRKFLADN